MSPAVPHSRPTIGREEAAAAHGIITSGRLAQGEEVAAFEADVADYLGRRFAVAVSSGTAALHLALASLELPGDELVGMPSHVCTALLHAARAAGMGALIADVEAQSRNLDAEDLVGKGGRDCAAIILPHMFGLPANVEAVAALGRPVIEDCAMALGATGDGRKVGSTSEIAICSFYATKMITSGGEGGMLLTDNLELAERSRELREYDGLTADRPRYNYKMTDVAAAVGRVQLRRLDGFVARRREIAAEYDEAFSQLPVSLPIAAVGAAFHRYLLRLSDPVGDLPDRFERRGVAVRKPVPVPLHRQPGRQAAPCPEADRACERDLSIPLFPSLSRTEVDQVMRTVRDTLEESG